MDINKLFNKLLTFSFVVTIFFGSAVKSYKFLNDCDLILEECNNDFINHDLQIRNKLKTFYIAMKIDDVSEYLVNHVANRVSDPLSKDYGNYLTNTEISEMVNISNESKETINKWLYDYGLKEAKGNITWYADAAKVNMPCWLIQKIFHINMDIEYGNELYTQEVYQLPPHIDSIVEFIEGLSLPNGLISVSNETKFSKNYLNFLLGNNYGNNDDVDQGVVGREVIDRIYDIPSNLNDTSNTSIGVIEFFGRNGYSPRDLSYSQVKNGLPNNPLRKNHILGLNIPSPDPESSLDIQMIGSLTANSKLWYEDTPGWMYTWALNFFNRDDIPYIVSISWGWNEMKQCSLVHCDKQSSKSYIKRANYEFAKLVCRGVTIVAASGDAGSPGRTDEKCSENPNHINSVFPSSSQWVTSVGATYLVKEQNNRLHQEHSTPVCVSENLTCATGLEQRITNFYKTGWTSGAGFSNLIKTPSYQRKEVVSYLKSGIQLPNYFNRNGRSYPDVSIVGHNCLVRMNTMWIPSDGTSCSAPMFAGLLAILNNFQVSKNRPRIGFANPLLYHMYQKDNTTFNDILVGNSSCTEFTCCGNNYGFVATTGYDTVSGLGTPNITRMLHFLDNNLHY